jgi:hypothetical protein
MLAFGIPLEVGMFSTNGFILAKGSIAIEVNSCNSSQHSTLKRERSIKFFIICSCGYSAVLTCKMADKLQEFGFYDTDVLHEKVRPTGNHQNSCSSICSRVPQGLSRKFVHSVEFILSDLNHVA